MILRRLTAGERALGWEMFGDGLDLFRVRLLAVRGWSRAFVPGPSLIVWPARSLPGDFAKAPLALQATFIHELTHVWQAQQGVRLLWAKLKAGDGARAYDYDLAVQPDFSKLNIEQQAMVVEHAFLAAHGAPTQHSAERYAELAATWRRV
jgi:hypothetical protein